MDTDLTSGMGLYHKIYDFRNLYNAYMDARKGKRWKTATNRFEANALECVAILQKQLREMNYRMGAYNVFEITEPKKRTIKSTAFKDKVVQRSLCDNVLEPLFERTLIFDNYACRRNKGTHAALKRTEDFYRAAYRKHGRDVWVLKCDIEKYFDSIDHEILKRMYRKHIKDDQLLWLLDMIVDSTEGTGVPIGNQTSQWFSIYFLNGRDHYIKEKLGIKWYVRYMDDFVLMHPDKEYLRKCKKEIEWILNDLGLKLNHKAHIFPLKHGVDFLGFHTYITETGKLVKKVRHDSNKRVKRKLKKFRELYRSGERTKEQIDQAYNSWKNHVRHGDSFYLVKEIDKLYHKIFEEDVTCHKD